MLEKAYELAAEGKTNAEIFGELELTSGALMALLQTKPQLMFSILNGRAAYCDPLIRTLTSFAAGETPLTKVHMAATTYLLERAEAQSKLLTIGHEMVLLAGTPATDDEDDHDKETVTAILRKKS